MASLPPDTAEWFLEECESSEQWTADAEGLKRFLILEILLWFRAQVAGAKGGPSVRLQAGGESLDPNRIDKLLTLDERLTQQFEKVMGLPIRLQEMRNSAAPPE